MEAFRSVYAPPTDHPNAGRWQRAIDGALARGYLVADILSERIPLRGADILDAGAGVGGTSICLAQRGAKVVALDRDAARCSALRALGLLVVLADASRTPFRAERFDGIVLQDVLEHCCNPAAVLREAYRLLRPGGAVYISTPNRYALVNFLADPHWGLPFIAVLSRPALRTALRLVRPHDAHRRDLARLLGFREFTSLLEKTGFRWTLRTEIAASALFARPDAVVWSRLHRLAARLLRFNPFCRMVMGISRREYGLAPRVVFPCWYALCTKPS
ncbi:MAG: class I SAM-dependent methyltransferase [Bacteroidota bacterium]|nr:class I SAM-dependent methyltransferase [Bacteroidota bacterium]